MRQLENKSKEVRFKPNYLNNPIKYKRFEYLNQKTEFLDWTRKARANFKLPGNRR